MYHLIDVYVEHINGVPDQTRPDQRSPSISYPSQRSRRIAKTVKGVTNNFNLYLWALR